LNLVKKWVKNIHSRLFLLPFNSKLSHFDKNLNLNHKWFSPTYGFVLWRSPWTFRASYGERFPQKILPYARTFVNVVQHLRDFGRFEMNTRDLGRERDDRILVVEEEILHEIENHPRTSTRGFANHLGVF
jgi:hypothetical protein